MDKTLKVIDVSLICGQRGAEAQAKAFYEKKSKLPWPLSSHNRTADPSLDRWEYEIVDAVDVAPYPSLFSDREQVIFMAGIIQGIADEIGINIRIGADWNSDGVLNNKKGDFFDGFHIELVW